MKKQKTEKLKTNKGITLIALVITIIVMLILVAVTINMAVNGGLFDYAGKATGETKNAINEEQDLANGKIQVDGKWYDSIDDYLAGNETEEPYLGVTITSQTEGVIYTDKDGNVKELTEAVEDGDIIQYGDYEYRYNEYFLDYDNGDYWFTDWTENTEQNGWGVRVLDDTKESYGEICGTILDSRVNTVSFAFFQCANLKEMPKIPNTISNMDGTFGGCILLEKTTKIPDSVISMDGTFRYCESLKIPPVLSNNLTNMSNTFYGCVLLEKSPDIPDSVVNMPAAFTDCKNLVYPPVLPDNVTSLALTFSECEKLIKAPEIPSKVENMIRTFSGCISLTKAPTIPESVFKLSFAFLGCTNLTGEVEINAKRSMDYNDMFKNTVLPIVIHGSSPYLEAIAQSASNGNVTIKE